MYYHSGSVAQKLSPDLYLKVLINGMASALKNDTAEVDNLNEVPQNRRALEEIISHLLRSRIQKAFRIWLSPQKVVYNCILVSSPNGCSLRMLQAKFQDDWSAVALGTFKGYKRIAGII